jgi:hypothetical protein
MEDVGIFMAIVSILRPNGIFHGTFGTFGGHSLYVFTVLVSCTEKNLATLRLNIVEGGISERR